MNRLFFFVLLLQLCLGSCLFGQCNNAIVFADSSFESGVVDNGPFPYLPGYWYRDDGLVFSSNAHTGDTCACSYGGGAFQVVSVDSQTTYYIGAYIRKGADEVAPYPLFRINWLSHPITVNSNSWTFVSTSFYTGSDTTAIIGFYSMEACFDDFRISCTPFTSIQSLENENNKPYSLLSNVSNDFFILESEKVVTYELWSINGALIEKNKIDGEYLFGHQLINGVYFLRVFSENKSWVERIVRW